MYLEILKDQPFWYNLCIWKYWRTSYLKASPLPPAPLAARWPLICRLEGLAGFEGFPGMKSVEHCLKYTLFCNTICHWILLILSPFRALGSPFWLNLEVLGTILAPFWWSSGTQMHSKEHWKVPGWILDYFWWILGPPSDTILDHFLIFSVIWIVKKYVWIVGMTFIDCWMENLLISDVPTYQFVW